MNNKRVLIEEVIELMDNKLDELIGYGDFSIKYNEDLDRIYTTINDISSETTVQDVTDIAHEVLDFLSLNGYDNFRCGNSTINMFWITNS